MELKKDLKILVVDDSPGIRMVAKKIFSKLEFSNVTMAEDGATALAKLESEPFELVISDMNMPGMSGIDLLNEMKKRENLKDVLFLLVTAEEDQEEIMQAIRAGINNFMPKPWNVKTLLEKMERVFTFQEEKRNRPKFNAVD